MARHGATGPDDRLAARFGAFGRGSCLAFPTGAVFGERWIHIGQDTLVGPHVSISAGMVPGQAMVTDPVVRVGDRCMIGRGSHIVGHFEIDIGDDVHTGPYVYVTDQNHGYEDPDKVVHAQWPTDVPVRIGAGSWLGTGVVVLPGSRAGEERRGRGGGGGAGNLPRPLCDRRRTGPDRPPLRPRLGLGRRSAGGGFGADRHPGPGDGSGSRARPDDLGGRAAVAPGGLLPRGGFGRREG